MSLESDRFARVTALDRWASDAALAAWAGLDLADLQGSFVSILPFLLDTLETAQFEAADIGADFTDAVAEREGVDAGPRVNRSGFVGVASDGRSLTGLLSQPLVGLFKALAVGVREPVALQWSRDSFDEILTTQVHDAARESEHVALAANTELAGYLRVVEPGACARCIILAGRFYKWNAGFLRHPKCRCNHRPLTKDSEPQSDREIFDQMTTAEQDRAFTKDGAAAIRLGAEPNLVVNARRGMSTPTTIGGREVVATTEGTSKRGLAYQRLTENTTGRKPKTVVRLMPGSLIKFAKDRDDAIRLLKLHGYIL